MIELNSNKIKKGFTSFPVMVLSHFGKYCVIAKNKKA